MPNVVGTHFFPEIAAGGFSRVDGTIQFWQRVDALIGQATVVLDFGAGRGANQSEDTVVYRRNLRSLKGRVREVIGVDVDPVVLTNSALDRAFVVKPDETLPLPDQSIDVIVSDFVFEHIQDPAWVAFELDRVLSPGGWICARTPIATDISRWPIGSFPIGCIPKSFGRPRPRGKARMFSRLSID